MTRLQKLGLFLAFFFANFLFNSREPPWNDAKQIQEVAESIVKHQTVDVTVQTGLVHNGKNYAFHPLLPSLIHVPGAIAHKLLKRPVAQEDTIIQAMTSHLGPSLLGALVCLLFAQLCLDLGLGGLIASLGGLAAGCGTMIAVYARMPYSEITQAAAYAGFFVWLLRVARAPERWTAILLGVWIGLLVNSKVVFVLCLPGAALFAGWHVYRAHGREALIRTAGWVTVGGFPFLVMLLAYNHVRTGSFVDTGYALPHEAGRSYDEHVLLGVWGLFFSVGKSAFLYNPPLIASMLCLPRALRTRDRRWLVALLATASPVVALYGKSSFWSGDWCWGPRYVLFLIPILLLPALFWMDDMLRARRYRLAFAVAGPVLAIGTFVQVLGGMFYWDHYIRIALVARNAWLGQPNRAGSFAVDKGGNCGACFEDVYAQNWLPAFQPIEGHFWLMRHLATRTHRDPWEVAEADAPWHRYTAVRLNISNAYARSRLDWWFYDWKGPKRPRGWLLVFLMTLGMGGGGFLWWRGQRWPAAGAQTPDLRDDPPADAPPALPTGRPSAPRADA